MNDVLIIGLGLLGSSLAYSLKANGYHVFAYDKDESSLAFPHTFDILPKT